MQAYDQWEADEAAAAAQLAKQQKNHKAKGKAAGKGKAAAKGKKATPWSDDEGVGAMDDSEDEFVVSAGLG